MHNVSNEYKQAVYAPTRACKGRVTFDISDITAAGDVSNILTNTESSISNKSQLINKNRSQSYNLATCEPNRFKLDGSFCFADDALASNKEVGFCSNDLCSEDGTFTPYQVLSFQFNANHSSMGLTITFDVPGNEYATDFAITAYDGNNVVIDSVDITGNTLVQCTPLGQLYLYRKVEITIKKWCKGNRRCRVAEVDFGVVKVYEDSNLIKMSLIEEMDLTSSLLSSPEFKFTVDNANREFNILNPSGFYKFLQQRQQVLSEIGVELEGTTEYIPLGNYLLCQWKSDEGSLTASFTARTPLDLLSNFDYENLIVKSNYSLYDMAVDLFAICGITDYEIDIALQSISTLGLIRKTNCKSALQMVVIAGCANIFIKRAGTIVIKVSPLSIGVSVDAIEMDNMYKEPQIELDSVVKAIDVSYFTDIDNSTVVTISNSGISKGEVLKVEGNSLINTSVHATNVANWILLQRSYRAIYSVNWRGNPSHELDDIVSIENSYGVNKNAFITKIELNYQGYLSAKTEARGLTDVVD